MHALTWILLVLALVLGLAVGGYFYQYKFIYFPESELRGTPDDKGLEYRDVYFSSSDGLLLHAWLVPAKETDLVVLFCHGNAGNISHRLETLQILHNLGLSVFIFDYRGFGKSQGTPSEQGTYKDARAAREYLLQQEEVAPEKILLWGRSLGGPVAAAMAREKQPGALVLESTFTSMPEMAKKVYPYLTIKSLLRFDYPTQKFLQQVSCPVLVMHSPEDELVPYQLGRDLFATASAPKRFLQLKGGHLEAHLVSRDDYVQGVNDFVSELLLSSNK